MQSQHVDVSLDFVHAKEVTAHIQHHTTIAKPRVIVNLHSRQFHILILSYSDRLSQSLYTIENTSFRSSGNHHIIRIHLQLISLRILFRQTQQQYHCTFFCSTRLRNQVNARLFFYICSQILGIFLHFFISCRINHCNSIFQQKRSRLLGS